jgi:hypothetical protein
MRARAEWRSVHDATAATAFINDAPAGWRRGELTGMTQMTRSFWHPAIRQLWPKESAEFSPQLAGCLSGSEVTVVTCDVRMHIPRFQEMNE